MMESADRNTLKQWKQNIPVIYFLRMYFERLSSRNKPKEMSVL